MSNQLDRWLRSKKIAHFDLRELILVKQFLSKLLHEIKQYCVNRNMQTVQEWMCK